MEATEIIEYLRLNDFIVKADGDCIELSPPEKVTNDLIKRLRQHKPAIIAELRREQRRQKVLTMLADNPDKQRAYTTDGNTDPDNVILTVGIKNQYTFEMLIPKAKYDPFLLIDLMNKGNQ